jgi:CRP-like cAMP-binding protein
MKRKAKLPFDLKAFLSKVNGGRAIADYRKDQIVYTQGESADSVFYIRSGKVKKTVISEQGKEAVVALLGTGDFFGEGCLTGQLLRLATVSAMTECVIVRITKADITRVIHDEPAFAELFIAHLLARNSRVEEDLVDQLFNSSEKRLARILLLLANFGKEGRPEPIIAKISQETLAEMIGTTRSRVSFFMNKFRELGLIDYNGHIEVHTTNRRLKLSRYPLCCRATQRKRASNCAARQSDTGGIDHRRRADDKPDPATARSGRAKAIISPSRWYKKSVRP